jgi:hypothetical protein
MIGLSYFPQAADEALANLPRVYAEPLARSPVGRKDFPVAIFSALTSFAATLSFIFVGVTLIKYWKTVSVEQKIFCFVIIFGLMLNAFICGALSGPHERYQARLLWLIPVLALILYYERVHHFHSLFHRVWPPAVIASGLGLTAAWITLLGYGLSAVPLPAALPLLATGLGALGLLGWHRKRKDTGFRGSALSGVVR